MSELHEEAESTETRTLGGKKSSELLSKPLPLQLGLFDNHLNSQIQCDMICVHQLPLHLMESSLSDAILFVIQFE